MPLKSALILPLRKAQIDPTLSELLRKNSMPILPYFPLWELFIQIGYKNVWSNASVKAKIDTGAAVTLIPEWLVKTIPQYSTVEFTLYGVVKIQECRVPVNLGKCDLLLQDQFGSSIIFSDCWVATSKLPNLPILVGMKDVLEKLNISKEENDLMLSLINK